MSAPHGVAGSTHRTHMACQFMRNWRSFRLTTWSGSHPSMPSSSATEWKQSTWMAFRLSGTTLYVCVRVHCLASAPLTSFIHRLHRFLNVRCLSIQTPRQGIPCLLICMNPFLTFIFAVSFVQRCFLWPHLRINSTTSVFAVLHCSPHILPHLILCAAHLSSVMII